MKTEEEFRRYMQNVWNNYMLEYYDMSITTRTRSIVILEACLVIANVLQAGVPFEYKQVEDTKYFLGIFSTKKLIMRKETYGEHILRLTEEYLGI